MKSVSKAAEMIVDYLLDADLAEAAVRPPRSRRWVAVFDDGPGNNDFADQVGKEHLGLPKKKDVKHGVIA